MFRQNMLLQFNKRNINNNKSFNNKLDNKKKNNLVEFSNLSTPALVGLSLLIPPKPSKDKLNKSKFYNRNKGKTAS